MTGLPHDWTLTLLSSKLPLLTGTWLYCATASFKFLSCCKLCWLAVTSSCSGSRTSSRLLQIDRMGKRALTPPWSYGIMQRVRHQRRHCSQFSAGQDETDPYLVELYDLLVSTSCTRASFRLLVSSAAIPTCRHLRDPCLVQKAATC